MRNGRKPGNSKTGRAPQLVPFHWAKGQSGNPRGRPKGQIDKVHRLQLQAAAAGKHTPLDILLAICRKDLTALAEMDIDPRDCTIFVRKSAAEACLPYLHRRMPIAIDGGEDKPLSIDLRAVLYELECRHAAAVKASRQAECQPQASQSK